MIKHDVSDEQLGRVMLTEYAWRKMHEALRKGASDVAVPKWMRRMWMNRLEKK